MYRSWKSQSGWRVVFDYNGDIRDLCGAINEIVALEQAGILNQMRKK